MADLEANGTNASGANEKIDYSEDENKERGNWSGRMDFVLSMLGYAVGLGNIWRFPYLCYRNGGGAFLFPYLLMLALVGIPLFYLEVSLGQFCSKGAAKCWDFAPMLKGLGIAMIMCSTLVTIYYNVIIAWSQFYFFVSFTDHVPWDTCEKSWNSEYCSLKWPLVSCVNGTAYSNGTCFEGGRSIGIWNRTIFEESTNISLVSPSEEYWTNEVLGLSDGLSDMGNIRWPLAVSLVVAWIVTFLCLLKGIKTTGKVVYFTALFPYVVLVILFFRGVTLGDGVADGISFYIKPNLNRLKDAEVWRDAANQIFYSLGPSWGGLVTLASYNRFHNAALTDTLIVAIGNSCTSLFGGFVIFSYLGYMAAQLDVDIEQVVRSGPGLAFIVYPEAVTHLPAPPFWAIAFFFMLILLGLDSQFAMVETLLSGILDQWPKFRKYKTLVILIICVSLLLLGLPIVTEGGAYLFNLMDTYAASYSLMTIGILNCVSISYLYGAERFFKDMTVMYGTRPSIVWKIFWMLVSPALVLFILIFAIVDYSPATYGSYKYSSAGEALGWLMVAASAFWIPFWIIYTLIRENTGHTLLEKWRAVSSPNKFWGPALVQHRKLIDYVPGFVVDPYREKENHAHFNPAVSMGSINVDIPNGKNNSGYDTKL
ncbi:hypothetical protein EGW08_009338 [Elysia chlorotica]|uniref:Transporter n=1 Tax=Elysia chlorotica TaxID=188477 RepID=A0A3S0ZN53_ELYCH|nr:hypothetical protein EGW08_009338 [Elysia chlorotica]